MQSLSLRCKASLCMGCILTILVACGSFAVAQICVQPLEGLVGWWPGDGNADDMQGGNSGILQAG